MTLVLAQGRVLPFLGVLGHHHRHNVSNKWKKLASIYNASSVPVSKIVAQLRTNCLFLLGYRS